MPQTLRIGICGCTKRYHGEFEGRRLTLRSMRRRTLAHPIVLILLEFRVPERHQIKMLHRWRCHTFVDVHPDKKCWRTYLDVHDLGRDSYGREQVLYGYPLPFRRWQRKKAPTPNTILRALGACLSQMSKKKFLEWQGRMTPRGWKVPPRSRK